MVGVVSQIQIEAEERTQWDRLFTTTEELKKARSRIQILEVEKAKADEARQVSEGLPRLELVAPVNVQMNNASVALTKSDTSSTREQELSTLTEELEAQEALRARQWEQKKAMKEEKRKIEENLQKSH